MSAEFPAAYDDLRQRLRAEPRTWLVTGAAGFIGSNLLQELLELGQNVVGLDNFSTGHRANLDAVLDGVPDGQKRLRFFEGDIRDLDACRAACNGVDFVLHQAALGSVPRSIADPVTSSHVNVDGFLNILVASKDAGVQRIVYASSSSVYGDCTELPQRENRTGRPLSPYAATKVANEMYAEVFQRTYDLKTVGLRYFNVFGARQDPKGAYAAVIPRWIAAILDGAECKIFGDGETSRDFCYIANVVQANLLAAANAPATATGRAYNIACGDSTSLTALFYAIRDGLAEFRPDVAAATPVYDDFRPGDIARSFANITDATEKLGYLPTHRLRDGLAKTLAWYVEMRASIAARTRPQLVRPSL
jgi:UDP-N-acetylglucosamine 4-epimerase